LYLIDNCQRIEVFDNKNNETTNYESICAAARALDIPNPELLNIFLEINRSFIKTDISLRKFDKYNYGI
jgi:hypothetical protein